MLALTHLAPLRLCVFALGLSVESFGKSASQLDALTGRQQDNYQLRRTQGDVDRLCTQVCCGRDIAFKTQHPPVQGRLQRTG